MKIRSTWFKIIIIICSPYFMHEQNLHYHNISLIWNLGCTSNFSPIINNDKKYYIMLLWLGTWRKCVENNNVCLSDASCIGLSAQKKPPLHKSSPSFAQFPEIFVFQSLLLPLSTAVLHWRFFQGCDLIRMNWCELASRRSSPCADGGGESDRRTPASGLMRERLLSELAILLPLINPAGH